MWDPSHGVGPFWQHLSLRKADEGRVVNVLSVDLGTSNTVAVLSAHGRPPRVVDVDGASMMPSAVFAAEDGNLVVGRDAERRARLDPARFEPNPKRRVDEGTLLLGDQVVPVTDALAGVLRRVIEETSRQLGGKKPDEVRLTHPAQWGPVRRNVLLSAARQAGMGSNLVLVPEPVAAAAHFASFPGQTLVPGQALAVYDLGAGTFDVAIVGATQNGFVVLAEAGLPDLGGLDVDQALLEHVGRQVSIRDPGRWQSLLRPVSTGDRRAQRALREDVKAAKESLSRHPQTEVPLPEPFEDVLVTRVELEALIRPGMLRSVELLAGTIRSTGMSPGPARRHLPRRWLQPHPADRDADRRGAAGRADEPRPAGDGRRPRRAPRAAGGHHAAHQRHQQHDRGRPAHQAGRGAAHRRVQRGPAEPPPPPPTRHARAEPVPQQRAAARAGPAEHADAGARDVPPGQGRRSTPCSSRVSSEQRLVQQAVVHRDGRGRGRGDRGGQHHHRDVRQLRLRRGNVAGADCSSRKADGHGMSECMRKVAGAVAENNECKAGAAAARRHADRDPGRDGRHLHRRRHAHRHVHALRRERHVRRRRAVRSGHREAVHRQRDQAAGRHRLGQRPGAGRLGGDGLSGTYAAIDIGSGSGMILFAVNDSPVAGALMNIDIGGSGDINDLLDYFDQHIKPGGDGGARRSRENRGSGHMDGRTWQHSADQPARGESRGSPVG